MSGLAMNPETLAKYLKNRLRVVRSGLKDVLLGPAQLYEVLRRQAELRP